MSSIKTKLIILILLVAIVPLGLLGTYSYYKTTDIFVKSVQDSIHTIVKSKANALRNYIENTEITGQTIAANDALQKYISFNRKPTTPIEKSEFKALAGEVDHLLYSFQEAAWGKYHHIFLIDRNMKIVVSPNHGATERGSPSSHIGEDTSANKWAVSALTSGTTTVSDFSSWVESDHIHQMLFYPVKDNNGRVHALIGFELQIPHEQKLMTDDFELGKTGRVILATTKGVPILHKGMGDEPTVPLSRIIEAQTAGFSAGKSLNFAGVEVIDLYLKEDKYPWVLIAEIETEEVYQDINKLQKYVLIGLGLTLVIALAFAILFSNYVINPLKRLKDQIEQISLGKIDIKLDNIKRKDEIGDIVKAFDRIFMSFKVLMKRYKKLKAGKAKH